MWIDLTDFVVYAYQFQIRQARPAVSFPDPIPEQLIEEQGFAPVVPTQPPAYNPIIEDLIDLPPVEIDGIWIQQWAVEPATAEEIAQRIQEKRQNMNVTPFQAKAALFKDGFLDEVEALIADPASDPLMKLAWSNAIEYRRLSPMVESIASALSWTDDQLDALFEQAATITA